MRVAQAKHFGFWAACPAACDTLRLQCQLIALMRPAAIPLVVRTFALIPAYLRRAVSAARVTAVAAEMVGTMVVSRYDQTDRRA